MRCQKCNHNVPVEHAENIGGCPMCDGRLLPTTQELLSTPSLGLVREVRPSQIEFGKTVELSLQGNTAHTIFAEAPCGVGKTLGYCIPAILRKRRFVISTGKKNLQDQLDTEDLPRLLDVLKSPMTVTSLKGKNNYICRKSLVKNKGLFAAQGEEKVYKKILDWLDKSDVGDRNTLSVPWKYPATLCTATDCLGSRCSLAKRCGFIQQRTASKTADIVVANHSLLGFDLRLSQKFDKQGIIFGPYDLLIIDEAHLCVDFFRGAFSEELTPTWLKSFLSTLAREQIEYPNIKNKAAEANWSAMFTHIHPDAKGGQQVDTAIGLPPKFFGKTLTPVVKDMRTLQTDVEGEVMRRWSRFTQSTDFMRQWEDIDYALYDNGSEEDVDALALIMRYHEKISDSIKTLCGTEEEDDNIINCREMTPKGEYKIVRRPVDISKYVRSPLTNIPKKVLCSATLPFDLLQSELGIVPSTTITMPSAFNFKDNALLYLPKHLPAPPAMNHPIERYCEDLAEEIVQLTRASKGNAFILFPSRAHMEAIYKVIMRDYEFEYTIVGQMDGTPAKAAMEEFLTTDNAVIFGLKSFFEGVDVQGEKLRLVVLTKIPFPAPTELNKAKERILGKQYWNKYYFPNMLNDVQQAMGRLIRSQTDQGVAVILDPRIWVGGKKDIDPKTVGEEQWTAANGYGRKVFKALPFPNWTDDFYYVQKFFQSIL